MKTAISRREPPLTRMHTAVPGSPEPQTKTAVGHHADSPQKPAPKHDQGDRCNYGCYSTPT